MYEGFNNAQVHLLLELACDSGDKRQVSTIIRDHKSKVDVDSVLGMICMNIIVKDPGVMGPKARAIQLVLEAYRDCIRPETINRFFVLACKSRSPLAAAILESFGPKLTAESIEAALIECHVHSPETCLSIYLNCADSKTYRRDTELVLSPISLAIGWSISQRGVTMPWCLHSSTVHHPEPISRTASCMHSLLDHYYRKLSMTEIKDTACMMDCGLHCNTLMVSALIQIEPNLASKFLMQGVYADRPEVLKVIADVFSDSILEPDHIQTAIESAIWAASYTTFDTLTSFFGADVTQEMCIEIFNEVCNYGRHESLELVLSRFRHKLGFDNGFTFDPSLVKEREEIISILFKAYGSKLTDQFPDWKIEVQ